MASRQIAEFPEASGAAGSDVLLIQPGEVGTPLARITVEALLNTQHATINATQGGTIGGTLRPHVVEADNAIYTSLYLRAPMAVIDVTIITGEQAQLTPEVAGAVIYGAAENATNTNVSLFAYGTSVTPSYRLHRARGTATSPTSPQNNDVLGEIIATGLISGAPQAGGTVIRSVATQNWSGSANGAGIDILVTANSTTTPVTAAQFRSTGVTLPAALSVSGSTSLIGATTAKMLTVDAGSYFLSSDYSWTTTPFGIKIDLPYSATPTQISGGTRDLMRISINNDMAYVVNSSTGAFGMLRYFHITGQYGIATSPSGQQWDGGRVGLLIDMRDRSSPRSATLGPVAPYAYPPVFGAWVGVRVENSRGGTSITKEGTRGSQCAIYSSSLFANGATNLLGGRSTEHGFRLDSGASLRNWRSENANIMGVDGLIPTRQFAAYGGNRRGQDCPGFRFGYVAGEAGFPHIDELDGTVIGFRGGIASSRPRAKGGVDFLDGLFSKFVMRWPGGKIAGGDISDASAGAIVVGTGSITRTTDGVCIATKGWRGPASGTALRDGIEIIDGNTGHVLERNSMFECPYGGTYVLTKRDPTDPKRVNRLRVINPPVFETTPPASYYAYLRPSAGGVWAFRVPGTATTTAHPSQLTESTESTVVGRYLRYLTGVCAGEERLITGYDPSTKVITTEAFSASPTVDATIFTNGKFQLPISTGWTIMQGVGTETVVQSGSRVTLTGDGTNAAYIAQTCTVLEDTSYIIRVRHYGNVLVEVRTDPSEDAFASDILTPDFEVSEDDETVILETTSDFLFVVPYGATEVNIRLSSVGTDPVVLRSVAAATATDGKFRNGIRAEVVCRIEISVSTTEMKTLYVQNDGNPLVLDGGGLSITSLPTSPTGLPAGRIYNDGGVVKVVV